MKKSPFFSIIIPIYNGEKYLSTCIDSIYKSTFKDFEIIAVNDGSIDKSLELLNSYKAEDKRIKILNQTNQGLLKARYSGLSLASGEYIIYIDCDDKISPILLERIYKICSENKQNNFDVILYGCRCISTNGEHLWTYSFTKSNSILEKNNILNSCMFSSMAYAMWLKCFRRKFITSVSLPSICDSVKRFEDCLTTYIYMSKAKLVYSISSSLYFYIQHDNTLSKSLSWENWKDNFLIETNLYILEDMKKNNCFILNEYKSYCLNQFINNVKYGTISNSILNSVKLLKWAVKTQLFSILKSLKNVSLSKIDRTILFFLKAHLITLLIIMIKIKQHLIKHRNKK